LRVTIIGGGFTGAAVALNLLEMPGISDITIIEPRAKPGAGLAYSTPDPAHRVNVPAIRLLVHPREPGAFHAWLETSGALRDDPAAELPDGRRYPRRAVFGHYVHERLMQAANAPAAPPLRHIRASALALRPHGRGYAIGLDNGAEHLADIAILAVSHPAPAVPAPLRAIAGAPKCFANPWAADLRQEIAPHDKVLIIGTALSTADVIAALEEAGYHNQILAVSRRGLVSRERRPTTTGPAGDFTTQPSRTAAALLRRARQEIAQAGMWEPVIEALRNQGGAIWAALPVEERRRFLRHLRTMWDVHRYQLAPQLAAILRAKTARGELRMQAARIQSGTYDGRFHITFRRGESLTTESFDAIINCTGPDHSSVIQTNPALASLAAGGLLRPDLHGLGIDTTPNANPLNAAGQPVHNLFIAGPLARACAGELMGLPQVTEHAALVAHQVAKHVLVAG
jgi:uncharacterized NAD(P)/FAD-binding protein YdhS